MMIEAATAEGSAPIQKPTFASLRLADKKRRTQRASSPIQLLPPRGSCRAATEGEVPNPTSLVRR